MSGTTDPTEAQVALASYDRMLAETRKFSAEQNKLAAEAGKFRRDPWFLLIGALIAAVATRLPEILHAFGVGH